MRDAKPIPITYGEIAEYGKAARIGLSGLVWFAALFAGCVFVWIIS